MGDNKSGNIWMQAAAGAASSGIGMGMQRIGINYDYRKQREQTGKLMQMQMDAEKQMMEYQNMKQLEMWEKTGYGAQIDQMKRAGLNPALMYGMGGGGGQTTGDPIPDVTRIHADDPNTRGMGIQYGMQSMMQAAQIELIKAQTKKTNVEAEKTGGADTANIQSQTTLTNTINELKKLDLKMSENTLWERINEIVSKSIQEQEKGVQEGIRTIEMEETVDSNINRIKEEALIPAVQKRLMEANITLAEEQVNKIAADIWKIAQDVQIAKGHLNIAEIQQQFETNWDNIIGKGAVHAIGGLIQALPFAGVLKMGQTQNRPPVIKGFGGKKPY